MTEQTLIILKPDAVEKGVTNQVLDMLRDAGLKISHVKQPIMLSAENLAKHYKEHEGKPFYNSLLKFMTSGPAIPAVVEGENAVKRVREVVGTTIPAEAEPGTIRHTFSDDTREVAEKEGRSVRNIIHASGNIEEAKSELKIWFPEIFNVAPTGSAPIKPKNAAAMAYRF